MRRISKRVLSFVLACAMIVPMFIMPSQAEATTVQSITSPEGYSNIELRVTTDKEPVSYRIGEKVTFTIKAYADNVHVSVPMIKYTLQGDGNEAQGVAKMNKSGTLYPDENGVFTLTEDLITIPGYMRLEGDICSANGTKWAKVPNDKRNKALGAGILVDYENINTIVPMPEDFDEVWYGRLEALGDVAPKIARVDKVTKYYNGTTLKTVPENAGYDIYAFYIDCLGHEDYILKSDEIGNEKGATWAVAYITVPKNKTDKSLAISQGYLGGGVNTATPSTSTSVIDVKMSTHSVVLLCNENAADSTAFKEKYTDYILGGDAYDEDAVYNNDIKTCYDAYMLLRNVQMLRFADVAFSETGATALVDEDTVINGITRDELLSEMEYWKGLFNGEIKTSGGSQGGFQALGTAALYDSEMYEGTTGEVVGVDANVPSMSNIYVNTYSDRVNGYLALAPGNGLIYCDTAFLVRRINAPVNISARLVDQACLPSGVASIWNNLIDSKKDVEDYEASIVWIQSATHTYVPPYAENQQQTIRTYEVTVPEGIANNTGGFTASGYTDIDGVVVDQDAFPGSTGYIQIATSDKTTATVAAGYTPKLFYMNGANAYYNAEQQKLVFVSNATVSGSYGGDSISTGKNTNAEGSVWYLMYWAKENTENIKSVEFRYGTGGTSFYTIGYLTSVLYCATSVKYDNKLVGCSGGGANDTSLLVGMEALTTAGHGGFAKDGTFSSTTYSDGVVDLSGFTSVSDSHLAYLLYNCSSVTAVRTNKLSGANMFEGCANLKTVTVPEAASLTAIGANCFKGCNNLDEINIECTLSSLTIGSSAFGGKAITINVKADADKAIVESALTAANIYNVTVLSAGEEPPAEKDPTPAPATIPPSGIPNYKSDYAKSGFSDIDTGDGYIQIGTQNIADATVGEDYLPKVYYFKGASAYYNADQKKLVLISQLDKLTAASEHTVKDGKNQNVKDAVWYLAFWVDQNKDKISELEFRRGSKGSTFYYIGYLTFLFENVTCVKIDSRLNKLSSSNKSASSIFTQMSALETAGHGDFAADGTFTPTSYTNGVVDLTGFDVASDQLAYTLYKCSSVTRVNVESLASNLFSGCSALKSVTLNNSEELTAIPANAFKGCAALEVITIKGSVASGVTIDPSAFAETTTVTVVVNTAADKSLLESAFTAANVTTVTVILAKEEVKEAQNAIVSEGFSVRMKDYTGLRALFSFDLDVAALNEADGLTLVSYGVIATSYNRFINTYESDEDVLFATARQVANNDGSAVKYIPVYNADGTGANRYVDYDTRTFCIALTNIESANALSDIYMAGYSIWVDANGNESYTITTYNMSDGQKAVNLYEITLGLTKTGVINSENTDDVCFWQTLKAGALTTNVFNTDNDSTAKGYTLPENGYYTYLDVDYHAYIGATKTDGYAFNPTGVDTQASGVVWSVLKYTDDEYVLILRNKDKSTYTELAIPQHAVSGTKYILYAPYDYRYGKANKVGDATLTTYNPALSQSDYNKIKTFVVDYGITGANASSLSGLSKVETIIYPNGLTCLEGSDYLLAGGSGVKNVIWCHTDESGNPVAHLSEFKGLNSLFDLRGIGKLNLDSLLRGCSSVENVIFSSDLAKTDYSGGVFNGTTSLRRAWFDGNAMPAEGTIDVSPINIKRLGKAYFNVGDYIDTIKLPDTIKYLLSFDSSSSDIGYWQVLGQEKSINYICSESVAEYIAQYVQTMRETPKSDKAESANYADKIKINGESVLVILGVVTPDAPTEPTIPTSGIRLENAPMPYEVITDPEKMPSTIEAWINPEDSTAKKTVFGNRIHSNIKGISVQINKITPELLIGGDNKITISFSKSKLTMNEWVHIALTIDTTAKKVSFYVNGALSEAKDLTDEQVTALNAVELTGNAGHLCIGSLYTWDAGLNVPFVGQMASFSAYSDVRTAEEIADDYKSLDDPDMDGLVLCYRFEEDGRPVYQDLSGNSDLSWKAEDYLYLDDLDIPDDYDYSLMVIGDTQTLIRQEEVEPYNELYDWLADNVESKKIQAVIGVGDITHNNIISEWEKSKVAFAKLDGVVKHFPTIGNHDIMSKPYDKGITEASDPDNYKQYLIFKDDGNNGALNGMMKSYYYRFEACGVKYLFLGLGYSVSQADVDWAKTVLEAHPDYNVIISTHAYLDDDGIPLDTEGATLTRELVLEYSNIVLVLCGHMHNDNVLLYTETRSDGSTVQAVLTNPQDYYAKASVGVATGLYFVGNTVYVANHLVGTKGCLGEDSVRTFELDLVQNREEN